MRMYAYNIRCMVDTCGRERCLAIRASFVHNGRAGSRLGAVLKPPIQHFMAFGVRPLGRNTCNFGPAHRE